MKLRRKLLLISSLATKRIAHLKGPALVNWSLTNRCNYRCQYCTIWNTKVEELNTEQIFFVIDELLKCGTKFIAFSGGEPLLREDIAEIINYCFKKGIYTKLTSNGSLIADKIGAIKYIDKIRLSFDGPKEIHDSHRQQGSFNQVMDAVKLLKKNNIKVEFNCVISKLNIDYIEYVLRKAKELVVRVSFQPLESRSNTDFINLNKPPDIKYKSIMRMLISEKKRGNRYIGNSLPALEYVSQWPIYKGIKCFAGEIFCRITADGNLLACDRLRDLHNSFSCLGGDILSKFRTLPTVDCPGGCWRNPTIELNYLLSFNPSSILNLLYYF